MGDNIVDLSTGNIAVKNQIGSYDQQWLENSKAKVSKQIDDEKKATLIMSRMRKQMNKDRKKYLHNYKTNYVIIRR